MAYKVSLDSDECMSAGRCIASAPGFFVFDDDEIATIDPSGTQPDDAELLKIARTCPSGADQAVRRRPRSRHLTPHLSSRRRRRALSS
ncbi:ferredoxin [Ilumatobacter sp.]|uniref:ferredoxin n=1 Tax=Ilumatobacter sp. TaxID=1967498 RepID=UPI003751D50C